MAFSPAIYFKMVESGEVQPSPIFCKCKMCRCVQGEGYLEVEFE